VPYNGLAHEKQEAKYIPRRHYHEMCCQQMRCIRLRWFIKLRQNWIRKNSQTKLGSGKQSDTNNRCNIQQREHSHSGHHSFLILRLEFGGHEHTIWIEHLPTYSFADGVG
jgi:hypothetical protein